MRTPFVETHKIKIPSDTISQKIVRCISQPFIGIFALAIIVSFFGAFYGFVFRTYFYLIDGKWSHSLCDLFFDIRIRGGHFINLCELKPTNMHLFNDFFKKITNNYDVSISLMLIGITFVSILLCLFGILSILNRVDHR